jgi:hypothetical protein
MNKSRHMRNGKIALNLLRYDVEWAVRRWGYFDKESTCKFFEYVVSLFKEDLDEGAKKTKATKSKKINTLPAEEPETPANVTEPEAAGVKEEESL